MNRLLRLFGMLCLGVASLSLMQGHPVRAQAAGDGARKLKVLLVTGGCCHDYGRQKQILEQGLTARAPIEMTIVHEGDGVTTHRHSIYEKPDWWKGYDAVIHNECSADVKDEAFIKNILAAHEAGVPSVVLHCGMHNYRSAGFPKATPWFEFTGLATTGHGPQQPIEISYDKENPITKDLADWKTINEELYNNTAGGVHPTATVVAKGKQSYKDKNGKEITAENIVVWTNLYKGKTKVFGTTLGHNNETVADARYLNLVARGLLWSTDRLGDFKASDQNVDVKEIKADPKPGKKEEKKPAAAAGSNADVTVSTDAELKCCGQE